MWHVLIDWYSWRRHYTFSFLWSIITTICGFLRDLNIYQESNALKYAQQNSISQWHMQLKCHGRKNIATINVGRIYYNSSVYRLRQKGCCIAWFIQRSFLWCHCSERITHFSLCVIFTNPFLHICMLRCYYKQIWKVWGIDLNKYVNCLVMFIISKICCDFLVFMTMLICLTLLLIRPSYL